MIIMLPLPDTENLRYTCRFFVVVVFLNETLFTFEIYILEDVTKAIVNLFTGASNKDNNCVYI